MGNRRYTGQKDQKGNKIYEKSIVLFEGKYYSIHFRDTAFYFSEDLNGVHAFSTCWENFHMLLHCEVVGDVKHNSDLLNQKKSYEYKIQYINS